MGLITVAFYSTQDWSEHEIRIVCGNRLCDLKNVILREFLVLMPVVGTVQKMSSTPRTCGYAMLHSKERIKAANQLTSRIM